MNKQHPIRCGYLIVAAAFLMFPILVTAAAQGPLTQDATGAIRGSSIDPLRESAAQDPVMQDATGAVRESDIPAPRGTTGPGATLAEDVIEPFGANLFTGNFLKTREDGLNPNYRVMQGDQVAVYTWGSVEISDIFTVDGQGNIFLPAIGPVKVEGVRNADLTSVVRRKIEEVYLNRFQVYTNLVTAQPVLVYVTGLVNHPGRYAGLPTDGVLYFLDLAGGIDTALGSFRDIEIYRADKRLAMVDLYEFLLFGRIPKVQLRDGDTILVKKRGPVVELTGDVARPARIELVPGTNSGEDLLAVVPEAASAVAASLTGFRNGSPFTKSVSVSEFRRLQLEDSDAVSLSGAGLSPTILVNIEGEHLGKPVISVKRGARLVDVLNYLRVDQGLANTAAVHIRRASVAKAQRDSISDALFRLERDALLALSSTAREAQIRVQEAELTQRFVERARNIDPLGIVVTSREGVQQNIPLEALDTIVIPVRTSVVRISGQVTIGQAVTHYPGWTIRDYIAQAGGYSQRADDEQVLLLKPNAQAVLTEDLDLTVDPGDEILVPPKIDAKRLQNAADFMEVIYKIALAARVAVDL